MKVLQFTMFMWTTPSLVKQWVRQLHFAFLPWYARLLFIMVNFSFTNSLHLLASFCLLMLSCSAFFLKMNDNFLVFFLSELPNLWQASISPISVTTSISARILITVSSKLSSVASSGMPQITVLFCCSYCSNWLRKDSLLTNLSSRFLYFRQIFV